MSITIKNILFQQYPAYHKGLWAFDSTRKTQTGFRYIVDVYSGGNNSFIGRWDPPPRPVDGYGLWSSSILQSLIEPSRDVHEASSAWFSGANTQVNYRLVLGEKTDTWPFTDNNYESNPVLLGYLKFINPSVPTDLQVGDQIIVEQSAGFTYAQYDGFATVIAVSGTPTTAITVNKLFIGSTPAEGGVIRKYDGSAFIVSGLTSGQTSWVYGSSFDREELEVYSASGRVIGTSNPSTTAKFLTDMPNGYQLRENARMFMPVPNYSGQCGSMRFVTYDRNNFQLGTYTLSIPASLLPFKTMLYCAMGPYDLTQAGPTVASGESIMFNSSARTVSFMVLSTGTTQLSEIKTYTVNYDCKRTEYLLLFLDKKGCWNTAAFTAAADVEVQTKKKTFIYDGYGQYASGSFFNDTASRGYTVYDSRGITEYTVRTEPMTYRDGLYLSEIYDSPCVYWMKEPTKWLPVIVNDKAAPLQPVEYDSLIQYEVTFRLAFNNNVNI